MPQTQFPATLVPDQPILFDANYRFSNADRAYIDGQILGIQEVIARGSNGNALSIQGVPVSNTPPTTGQVLTFNGTSWVPQNPSGGVTPGTAGQVFVTNATPAAVWTSLVSVELTHGRLTAGGANTDTLATMGPLVGSETVWSALYLLAHGASPTGSNEVLVSDGNVLYVLAPGLNQVINFGSNGAANYATLSLNGFSFASGATPTISTQSSAGVTRVQSQGTGFAALVVQNTNVNGYSIIEFHDSADANQASFGYYQVVPEFRVNAYGNGSGLPINFYCASVLRASIEKAHGRFTSGGGGSDFKAVIGPSPTLETIAANFWALPAATAVTSLNYAFAGDGTNTYFNFLAGGQFLFQNQGNTTVATLSPTALTLSTPAAIVWAAAVASPSLSQAAAASDVTPNALTIVAQAPFASATVHTTAGDVIVNTPASVSTGAKYGGFQVQYNNTAALLMGAYNNNATYSAIWFHTAAASPTASNFSLLSDGASYTTLNAAGGTLFLAVGNLNFFALTTSLLNVTLPVTLGSINGINTLTGGMNTTVRTVTANFTFDSPTTDYIVLVDTTSTFVIGTLPAPSAGRVLIVIDKANNFNVNNFEFAPHASEKMDGVTFSFRVVTSKGYRGILWSDGTDWYTL